MKYKFINILLFLASLVFLLLLFMYEEELENYHTEMYVVEPGDTAWKIMNQNNSANKDIRELIYYIEKDNNIQAGYLNVGQEIKIRIYEKR